MRTVNIRLLIAAGLAVPACAAPPPDEPAFDPDVVVAEIEQALRAEVRSFEAKDCAAALEYFADQEPLFVVGGRTLPTRADLEAACPRMTARIPDGASRPISSEHVHATGPRSGYSVTEFRIPLGPDRRSASQFVTKVWSKREGAWRIVHVHESVAGDAGPSAGPPPSPE